MSHSDQSGTDRMARARGLIREAVEWLSLEVNDQQAEGGAIEGIKSAEQSCRNALRQISGLETLR